MLDGELAATLLELDDPVEFARRRLNFEPDEVQAKVLRSRAQRLLLNCTRQWGKSTVTAVKVLHRAWSQPGSLVLVTAPCERQSGELIEKVRGFCGAIGVKPKGDGRNRLSVTLPGGSRIVGLPGNEAKLRGFSKVSMLVIDEASRAPDALYHGMRPVLAVSNGDLWLLSTPNGQRGFFWDEWAHGGDEWTRVSATAEECPRIPAAFLDLERERRTEEFVRQENFCEFVQGEAQLFDRETVEGAFTNDALPFRL